MSPGIGSRALSKLESLNGKTRRDRKVDARIDEERQERECYRIVNARDDQHCRVCARRIGGKSMETRTVHHHLIYRSQISVQGGRHHSQNVLSICTECNEDLHTHGTLKLEGDADWVDPVTHKFAGVKVERLIEQQWTVIGWV